MKEIFFKSHNRNSITKNILVLIITISISILSVLIYKDLCFQYRDYEGIKYEWWEKGYNCGLEVKKAYHCMDEYFLQAKGR